MRFRFIPTFLLILLLLAFFAQSSTGTTLSTQASYNSPDGSDSDPQSGSTGTILSSVEGSSEAYIFSYAGAAQDGYLAAETLYMSGSGYIPGDPPVLPRLQAQASASWEESFTAVETKNYELQLKIPAFSLKFDDNSWTGMDENTAIHMISAYDIKVKVDGSDVWTSSASFEGGQAGYVLNRSGTELSATYGTSDSIYFWYDFPANNLAIDLGAITTGQGFIVKVELTARGSGPPLGNGSNCDIGGLGDPPSFSTTSAMQARLVAPYIEILPETVTLAATQPGETSDSQVVTITNTGLEDLEITEISLSDDTNFSIDLSGGTVPCSTLPVTLTPDSICTVSVAFSPQLVGTTEGELAITSNALNGSPKAVTLSGNGWSPFNPWSKTYGGKRSEKAIDFFQTADGGYMVLGKLWDGSYAKPWVLKLTGSGSIEWQKIIDSIGDVESFNPTGIVKNVAGSGCVIAGKITHSVSNPGFWMVELDQNGGVLLEKSYSISGDWSTSVKLAQTSDDNYAISYIGYTHNNLPMMTILKLDAVGDILWQTSTPNSPNWWGSISATNDGGVLFSSHISLFSASCLYRRYGSDGALKWNMHFYADSLRQFSYAAPTTDGDIILASDTMKSERGIYVAKFTESWDPFFSMVQQWGIHIFVPSTYSPTPFNLETTPDGGCLVFMPIDDWIGKLDADGTLVWQSSISPNMKIVAVRQTTDGGYALIGTQPREGGMDEDLFAMKLDSQGLMPGCDDIAPAALITSPIIFTLFSPTLPSAENIIVNDSAEKVTLASTEVTPNDGCMAAADDDDADGVPTAEECGPDGTNPDYDGNGDRKADSEYSDTASFHVSSGEYITLAVADNLELLNVGLESNPSPEDSPGDMNFNYDTYSFSIETGSVGGAATVTLYLPDGISPDTYYKYGKTPDNEEPHWYEFLFDGETGAEINENIITLHFIDGKRGDDDIEANGIIIEPGGPAWKQVSGSDPSGTPINQSSGSGGGGGCFISISGK